MKDEKEILIATIIFHHVNYAEFYEIMEQKTIPELTEFLIDLLKMKYLQP